MPFFHACQELLLSLADPTRRERGYRPPKQLRQRLPAGFVFGKMGMYLAKKSTQDGHILVVGGSGSGKSSCLAIPSLLSWRQRVFAVDIKGELYGNTRHRLPAVKVFNPQEQSAAGYDPYHLLRHSANKVQAAQEIAIALLPLPPGAREPFWVQGARNILTACILHFEAQGMTFIETVDAIQSTTASQMLEILSGGAPKVRACVNQLIGLDTKTLAGLFTELGNQLIEFATDKELRSCLGRREIIKPADLENGFDVFLIIQEEKLEQWHALLRLIVTQFLKHFERRGCDGQAPILFLLDEFARLGKMELMVGALGTLRSRRITICLIIQSLAQMDAIYGLAERRVIVDNCAYRAILSATDVDTQEYFSRSVGTYDRVRKSQSTNYGGEDMDEIRSTTHSQGWEEKRIIRPEQFATLKDLVLLTPYGFCRARKTPFYKTGIFRRKPSQ
jgi:type IV secretion system protein VirD4